MRPNTASLIMDGQDMGSLQMNSAEDKVLQHAALRASRLHPGDMLHVNSRNQRAGVVECNTDESCSAAAIAKQFSAAEMVAQHSVLSSLEL